MESFAFSSLTAISGIKIFLEPMVDATLTEEPLKKHWNSKMEVWEMAL